MKKSNQYFLTYTCWRNIKRRCAGLQHKKYYYDKGITICEEWKVFTNFLDDMGIKPKDYEIDRIDGAKGYYKDNCRWVTKQESRLNRIFYRKDGLPRGVRKYYRKYTSQIKANGKTNHLGYYFTPESAHLAFLNAYKKFHNGALPPGEEV